MPSTLFVWPVTPDFHPDPAREKAAKGMIQDELNGAGDVDCDSYPEPRLHKSGDEPYSARFVIRVCDAHQTLSEQVLQAVSQHLGCACKQALIVDD